MKTKKAQLSKAVVKTMEVLESLAQDSQLGITEIASRVGMHKSTVYRFVNSLKEIGFVDQDPNTERYSLTLKVFEIGAAVLDRMELWREGEPVMKRIAQETRETIYLATLYEDTVIYIGKIESTQGLRVTSECKVGQSVPVYCTGVGKTLLAYLPAAKGRAILGKQQMVRFTDKTITKIAPLEKELKRIREHGYAVNDEEHEVGVRCVAAPIYDNVGEVIAALSIAAPTVRMSDDFLVQYTKTVTSAAAEISARLGYRNGLKLASA